MTGKLYVAGCRWSYAGTSATSRNRGIEPRCWCPAQQMLEALLGATDLPVGQFAVRCRLDTAANCACAWPGTPPPPAADGCEVQRSVARFLQRCVARSAAEPVLGDRLPGRS